MRTAPNLGPGEPGEERELYDDVVLLGRLQSSLARLNPSIPVAALDDAIRAVLRTESPLPHEGFDGLSLAISRSAKIVRLAPSQQ